MRETYRENLASHSGHEPYAGSSHVPGVAWASGNDSSLLDYLAVTTGFGGDLETDFFGEGLELAKLFLLGGGLDGEGLAFFVGGCHLRSGYTGCGRACGR
jgi:hypothetical protein